MNQINPDRWGARAACSVGPEIFIFDPLAFEIFALFKPYVIMDVKPNNWSPKDKKIDESGKVYKRWQYVEHFSDSTISTLQLKPGRQSKIDLAKPPSNSATF